VLDAALAAGAYGVALSGAGSSLLALCAPATADAIRAAMERRARELSTPGDAMPLAIDRRGLILTVCK
jgi:homoserine kinase